MEYKQETVLMHPGRDIQRYACMSRGQPNTRCTDGKWKISLSAQYCLQISASQLRRQRRFTNEREPPRALARIRRRRRGAWKMISFPLPPPPRMQSFARHSICPRGIREGEIIGMAGFGITLRGWEGFNGNNVCGQILFKHSLFIHKIFRKLN